MYSDMAVAWALSGPSKVTTSLKKMWKLGDLKPSAFASKILRIIPAAAGPPFASAAGTAAGIDAVLREQPAEAVEIARVERRAIVGQKLVDGGAVGGLIALGRERRGGEKRGEREERGPHFFGDRLGGRRALGRHFLEPLSAVGITG